MTVYCNLNSRSSGYRTAAVSVCCSSGLETFGAEMMYRAIRPRVFEDLKLATFKKISKSEMSKYKVILAPMMRDDTTMAGRVTVVGIGDCGSIDVKSTAPDDPGIVDAVDQAGLAAGADGVVGVYDPGELWAPDWPRLT